MLMAMLVFGGDLRFLISDLKISDFGISDVRSQNLRSQISEFLILDLGIVDLQISEFLILDLGIADLQTRNRSLRSIVGVLFFCFGVWIP